MANFFCIVTRPLKLILFLIVVCEAIENPYSDSVILLKDINLYVDGTFSGINSAYLDVDIQTSYGYPAGSKTKRSSTTVKLYTDGPARYRVNDVQIMLENPLNFIRTTAILEITYFFNLTFDQMTGQIFTIQDTSWTNDSAAEKTLNITFNRPNWILSLTYKKNCDRTSYYGFDCDVYCPVPASQNECYVCDLAFGNKTCCKDPAFDPFTCIRIGSNGTRPLTCEEQLALTKADYEYQNKWRTVYFWIMIGFVIIALILLAFLLCCLFSVIHYRKKSEDQQGSQKSQNIRVQPSESNWSSSHRQPMDPYSQIYDKSLRRRRPSNPQSPELQRRRRPASVATVESELRSSVEYPNYPQSPPQRRRIEQLV